MDIYNKFTEINVKLFEDYIYLPQKKINDIFFIEKIKKFLFNIKENDSRPIMLRIEIVNICSNNCIICTKQISTRKESVMELEVFEKILQDYSDMGGGKISLTPTGGDIFLDPLLLKRLEVLKKYPKIKGLSVTTNAIVADKYTDDELRTLLSNFDRIHVSIYGIDDEEYLIMTRKNNFPRMVNNIKRIIKLKKMSTKLIFGFRLLKKRTKPEIDSWIQTNFSHMVEYSYTHEYYNWGDGIVCTNPLPFDAQWLPPTNNNSRCFYPFLACQIFSNGNVSHCPCEDYNGVDELNLGNIKNMSLNDIINSEKNRVLWDSSKKIPKFCICCNAHKSFPPFEEIQILIDNPSVIFGA